MAPSSARTGGGGAGAFLDIVPIQSKAALLSFNEAAVSILVYVIIVALLLEDICTGTGIFLVSYIHHVV
jgi:hypothetical protein